MADCSKLSVIFWTLQILQYSHSSLNSRVVSFAKPSLDWILAARLVFCDIQMSGILWDQCT